MWRATVEALGDGTGVPETRYILRWANDCDDCGVTVS